MEMLLQSAAEGKGVCHEAVQEVVEHFSYDLNLDDLCTELALLKNVQLLLVVPAISATSERHVRSCI